MLLIDLGYRIFDKREIIDMLGDEENRYFSSWLFQVFSFLELMNKEWLC